jgi:hypothetical protein
VVGRGQRYYYKEVSWVESTPIGNPEPGEKDGIEESNQITGKGISHSGETIPVNLAELNHQPILQDRPWRASLQNSRKR